MAGYYSEQPNPTISVDVAAGSFSPETSNFPNFIPSSGSDGMPQSHHMSWPQNDDTQFSNSFNMSGSYTAPQTQYNDQTYQGQFQPNHSMPVYQGTDMQSDHSHGVSYNHNHGIPYYQNQGLPSNGNYGLTANSGYGFGKQTAPASYYNNFNSSEHNIMRNDLTGTQQTSLQQTGQNQYMSNGEPFRTHPVSNEDRFNMYYSEQDLQQDRMSENTTPGIKIATYDNQESIHQEGLESTHANKLMQVIGMLPCVPRNANKIIEKLPVATTNLADPKLALQTSKQDQCEICVKSFDYTPELCLHGRKQTDENTHQCKVCSKRFNNRGNLTQHKKIHRVQKPYECSVCGKRFIKKYNLTHHEYIHTGEKPYECTECGKSFSHPCNLTQHSRIHKNETPYLCDICGKSFTQAGNLTVHKRLHTGVQPYQCDVCNESFRYSRRLASHKVMHKRA